MSSKAPFNFSKIMPNKPLVYGIRKGKYEGGILVLDISFELWVCFPSVSNDLNCGRYVRCTYQPYFEIYDSGLNFMLCCPRRWNSVKALNLILEFAKW